MKIYGVSRQVFLSLWAATARFTPIPTHILQWSHRWRAAFIEQFHSCLRCGKYL